MASGTNFPTSIDVISNKIDGVDDILAAETNLQSSAIEALQAKVGADSSAVTTSHDYRINDIEAQLTDKGDLITSDGTGLTKLALSAIEGQVLTVDSSEAGGIKWATNPAGFPDPMTTRGDIIYKNSAGTSTRLPAGDAKTVLTSDGTDIAWVKASGGSGDILSTLATVNELEKQGIKTALPNPDVIVESFTELEGQVTLQANYVGGTSIVLTKKIGLIAGNTLPVVISDSNGVHEVAHINAFVSGSAGAWTYSLASALANNYTTANSAKVANYYGSTSGQQLAPITTKKLAMFLRTLFLNKKKDSANADIAMNIYSDSYLADLTDLATNVIRFTASADVSANWKNNDYVILFKRTPEKDSDTVVLQPQAPQATGAYSWFLVQLDSDGTWSSPKVTTTFDSLLDPETGTFAAGIPSVGADTDNYYVMRLPALLDVILGTKTATTFLRLWPRDFTFKNNDIPYASVPYIHSHWKLNELSGNAINSRQPSGTYNLTEVGTVPSTVGKLGNSRGVFSTSNFFYIPGAGASIYNTNLFVIDGWFKTSVTGVGQAIIGKGWQSSNLGWGLSISSATNKLVFLVNTGGDAATSNNVVADGTWHYFAIRRIDATSVVLYVDGVAQTDTQVYGALAASTFSLSVGARVQSTGNTTVDIPFQGLLDSISYWSTTPSTVAEFETIIAQRYANGRGREYGSGVGYTAKYTATEASDVEKLTLKGIIDVQTADLGDTIMSANGAVIS